MDLPHEGSATDSDWDACNDDRNDDCNDDRNDACNDDRNEDNPVDED
jgi:hypothetical protein